MNNTYNPQSGKLYDSDGNVVYLSELLDNSNVISNLVTVVGNLTSVINLLKTSFGRNGGLYVDDALAHTPPAGYSIVAIFPLEDITLTTVGNITLTGVTIPQNFPVYGEYTSITLGSGSAIIYYGVN